MPLVDVEIVLGPKESLAESLAAALADTISEALGASPGHTWVKLRSLEVSRYSEGSQAGDETPRPVFVSVQQADLPTEAKLEQTASALAAAVARVCGRAPDVVHIVFQPSGKGRVAFGGKLMRARA